MPRNGKISARTLLCSLAGDLHTVPDGTGDFFRRRCIGTSVSPVVKAVHDTRKLERRLPQQSRKPQRLEFGLDRCDRHLGRVGGGDGHLET